MKASTLKSLGATRLSHQFRNMAAQVISAAEIRADHGGTSPETVAFFQDALAKTPGTPVLGANVLNGSNVTVKNSAGALSHVAVAAVSGTTLTDVKLASTASFVDNAVKQSGWTVTGTGTFFTPTVVAGVCTGGVLSES